MDIGIATQTDIQAQLLSAQIGGVFTSIQSTVGYVWMVEVENIRISDALFIFHRLPSIVTGLTGTILRALFDVVGIQRFLSTQGFWHYPGAGTRMMYTNGLFDVSISELVDIDIPENHVDIFHSPPISQCSNQRETEALVELTISLLQFLLRP